MKKLIIKAIKGSSLDFIYRFLKKIQLRRRQFPIPYKCLEFYSKFVNKGDLVFDVGANYGNRTKVFRKLGAYTIAFEPQEKCYEYLKNYFWRDSCVRIEKVALGKSSGTAKMRISKSSVLSTLSDEFIVRNVASGRFNQDLWQGEEVVQVSTLDLFIQKYGCPQFIKIDVEGFESQVVRGLTKTIRMLSLEFSTDTTDTLIDALGHLTSIGNYLFQFSPEETFYLDPMAWIDLKEIEIQLRAYAGLEWGDVYCKNIG